MADKRTYRTFGLLDIGTSKTVAAVVVAEHVAGLASPRCGWGSRPAALEGHQGGVLTDLDERNGRSRGHGAGGTRGRRFGWRFTRVGCCRTGWLRPLHGAHGR